MSAPLLMASLVWQSLGTSEEAVSVVPQASSPGPAFAAEHMYISAFRPRQLKSESMNNFRDLSFFKRDDRSCLQTMAWRKCEACGGCGKVFDTDLATPRPTSSDIDKMRKTREYFRRGRSPVLPLL